MQIFDNGFLTDATGRKINFRNTYIIMTSNVDRERIKGSSSLGFMGENKTDDLREKLKGQFKTEFINRIDEIIPFAPLDISALKEIAKIKILELQNRISSNDINLNIDSKVYEYLAEKAALSKGFGARPINRIIQTEIENKIAEMIISGRLSPGEVLKIELSENRLYFETNCVAIK